MIMTRDLTKVFRDRKRGEIRAVDRVNIQCAPGRVFGLLGPNGAGKTTVLRLLATILKPTSGTAIVNGYDILQEPNRVRSHVGFLSGDTKLYDRLTPREILFYFGRLTGMSMDLIEKRVGQIVELFGIGEYKDTRCGRLSGGMKQRVSIARTVIHDPPVLILDEPTAGLDIMATRTVVRFIKTCREQGKCTILSTHMMTEAERLCDEIAIIHEGRIKGQGSVQRLLEDTGTRSLEDAFVSLVGEET